MTLGSFIFLIVSSILAFMTGWLWGWYSTRRTCEIDALCKYLNTTSETNDLERDAAKDRGNIEALEELDRQGRIE